MNLSFVRGGDCRANSVSQGSRMYGKDSMACAIMPLWEKHIIPLFTQETQESFSKLIKVNS